jgi:hypothetical protein
MRNKRIIGVLFVTVVLLSTLAPLASADTLVKSDFEGESFAKTVDYYDYVRAYATLNGIQTPDNFDAWHANMYMTYVNESGLQLLYAGLDNVTFGNGGYLRIPMQSFIMHYKTNENNRDVVLASTFLMLMAFNETATSSFAGSPDVNDILYASFSLGFDLSAYGAVLPSLNSKTEVIPLTHSDDKLTWSWGMRYTNLTALWWRTWIDPTNPHFENSLPLAITTYDELTFMYTLTIDPAAGTATLNENHYIGRMRDLIVGALPLLWTYYNSTGHYGMLGRRLDEATIYDYIANNNLEMSIVSFQTSVLADHSTYSQTASGQNVTDADTTVTSTSIDTLTDDGEKILNADFETKKEYQIYNYTADPTESTFDVHDSVARTAKIEGFAGNGGLFAYHIGLMKFLPLVVAHMYPALLAKSLATIENMSKANYFYIVSYPQYSGFKVVQDPVLTAYIATSDSPKTASAPNRTGLIFIVLVVVGVAIVATLFLLRRKPKNQAPKR